jgi:hypothetical protein
MSPTHRSLPYDHLPAAANSAERVPQHHAQPLSTGWVDTRHSGLDDIAAACISRVATAACGAGGGTSEGRALGRIPSRSKPRAAPSFNTCNSVDGHAWIHGRARSGYTSELPLTPSAAAVSLSAFLSSSLRVRSSYVLSVGRRCMGRCGRSPGLLSALNLGTHRSRHTQPVSSARTHRSLPGRTEGTSPFTEVEPQRAHAPFVLLAAARVSLAARSSLQPHRLPRRRRRLRRSRLLQRCKVANRDTKVWHFVIENGY